MVINLMNTMAVNSNILFFLYQCSRPALVAVHVSVLGSYSVVLNLSNVSLSPASSPVLQASLCNIRITYKMDKKKSVSMALHKMSEILSSFKLKTP